jgi:histidinol-phosphate/aromatic aminotransferase/cobyric acid decarboxylase-like protein
MEKYNLPTCIRVSIGTANENKKVLKAFKDFYK